MLTDEFFLDRVQMNLGSEMDICLLCTSPFLNISPFRDFNMNYLQMYMELWT